MGLVDMFNFNGIHRHNTQHTYLNSSTQIIGCFEFNRKVLTNTYTHERGTYELT